MEKTDFGIVYKAALKVITIPQSDTEILDVRAEGMDEKSIRNHFSDIAQEFAREFELMSHFKGNSHVVSYENHQVFPHEDGIGWDILIQMELLTPLNQYAIANTVTRQDVIRLGIDLCKALEICQKYNVIHRDVKPENIFVSENGDFKLGDFGIARTVEKTTGSLSRKGTNNYMAPEVYRGDEYGSNVDIYSLGIVMYRLLNGNRTPFLPHPPAYISQADRDSAFLKRMGGAPLPKPIHAEGRLAEIVLKACAYDPKERYSSPVQMRQELESILYNREEQRYIYPEGDEVPQDCYVKTGEGAAVEPEDKTFSAFGNDTDFADRDSDKVDSGKMDSGNGDSGEAEESVPNEGTNSVFDDRHDRTTSGFDQTFSSFAQKTLPLGSVQTTFSGIVRRIWPIFIGVLAIALQEIVQYFNMMRFFSVWAVSEYDAGVVMRELVPAVGISVFIGMQFVLAPKLRCGKEAAAAEVTRAAKGIVAVFSLLMILLALFGGNLFIYLTGATGFCWAMFVRSYVLTSAFCFYHALYAGCLVAANKTAPALKSVLISSAVNILLMIVFYRSSMVDGLFIPAAGHLLAAVYAGIQWKSVRASWPKSSGKNSALPEVLKAILPQLLAQLLVVGFYWLTRAVFYRLLHGLSVWWLYSRQTLIVLSIPCVNSFGFSDVAWIFQMGSNIEKKKCGAIFKNHLWVSLIVCCIGFMISQATCLPCPLDGVDMMGRVIISVLAFLQVFVGYLQAVWCKG